MTNDLFCDLNPEQRAAVAHDGGPLLVIAGAGSGKTKTLSVRVARLILDGADPSRILLMTFSRRAATDMIQRATAAVAQASGVGCQISLPWAGTFHSVGARILRQMAACIGLPEDFTVHDRGDSADLMGMLREELSFTETEQPFPSKKACLEIYSRAINAEESVDEAIAATCPKHALWSDELTRLFAAYVEAKQKQGVLDYDDLLSYWADLMQTPLAHEVAALFDHVLVDEYQDTNRLQARILLGLKPNGDGLTVVGDDAQSIYSFRAAEVRNILDFPAAFTPAARVITLEQNYRSTAPILRASNAVIAQARERFTKDLRTTRGDGALPKLVTVADGADQARYVADQILDARERDITLKQQAVLFRNGHHSAELELELQRRKVPFVKVGGLKFLEAAHIKDIIAICRWAENPSDRLAGLRALQLLPGLGPVRARRILDALDAGGAAGLRAISPPPGASDAWIDFVALHEQLAANASWSEDLAAVAAWYKPMLHAAYEDASARWADVEQLVRIGAAAQSRREFLTDLALDPPNSTRGETAARPVDEDDYLTLTTIHSAKGQEWRCVYILAVVDGCIPSSHAIADESELEEERRLLYVAMTRAKDELHLLVPHRAPFNYLARGGAEASGGRSRLLPVSSMNLFEEIAWREHATPGGGVTALIQVDLHKRARSRWAGLSP